MAMAGADMRRIRESFRVLALFGGHCGGSQRRSRGQNRSRGNPPAPCFLFFCVVGRHTNTLKETDADLAYIKINGLIKRSVPCSAQLLGIGRGRATFTVTRHA